jgi:hypothetical protein
MVYGPYAEVDYDLTLCLFQSRLQHIYHGLGQPYDRVDLNPTPESTLSPCQGLGFGLRFRRICIDHFRGVAGFCRDRNRLWRVQNLHSDTLSSHINKFAVTPNNRLNMEVDLQNLFGLHVT